VAINSTTLSAAITATQTQFAVASTTNILAPVFTTGAGYTFMLIDLELMFVTGVPIAGTVQVIRGFGGSVASAHGITAPVIVGLPSDFPQYAPAITAFVSAEPNRFRGIFAPVASATTITASGPLFHVTGTTATATINLPANFVEGAITVIADGVWTWTAAGNIAVAGTVTTAGSTVTFIYDAATSKWYPSRLA
jgi:hypothetical protein